MRNLALAILIFAAGYYIASLQDADRDASGIVVTEGTINAFEMRIGDCFNDDPDESDEETVEVFGVAGVPCNEPHDNEVFAIFDTTEAEFPGSEAMSELAYAGCIDRFEAFVGRDYETSQLDVYPMYPTIESWNQRNDREVVCALYDLDLAKLTGSMRGSGI